MRPHDIGEFFKGFDEKDMTKRKVVANHIRTYLINNEPTLESDPNFESLMTAIGTSSSARKTSGVRKSPSTRASRNTNYSDSTISSSAKTVVDRHNSKSVSDTGIKPEIRKKSSKSATPSPSPGDAPTVAPGPAAKDSAPVPAPAPAATPPPSHKGRKGSQSKRSSAKKVVDHRNSKSVSGTGIEHRIRKKLSKSPSTRASINPNYSEPTISSSAKTAVDHHKSNAAKDSAPVPAPATLSRSSYPSRKTSKKTHYSKDTKSSKARNVKRHHTTTPAAAKAPDSKAPAKASAPSPAVAPIAEGVKTTADLPYKIDDKKRTKKYALHHPKTSYVPSHIQIDGLKSFDDFLEDLDKVVGKSGFEDIIKQYNIPKDKLRQHLRHLRQHLPSERVIQKAVKTEKMDKKEYKKVWKAKLKRILDNWDI
tara:strand:- start:170 stop:1435 length:1266 start_codon:yes stop_codon:yes gene_type:complete